MSDSNLDPTVFVRAGNDGPRPLRSTGVDVGGENFLPGSAVNIRLSTGARGAAMVGPDGTFLWGTSVRPPLACDDTVGATVHGADGIVVDGNGSVFCPAVPD